MGTVKVVDRPDLIKDLDTGAILTVDKRKADEYMMKKSQINRMKEVQEEIETIKQKLSEIDNIKDSMCEIKGLLKELVNK